MAIPATVLIPLCGGKSAIIDEADYKFRASLDMNIFIEGYLAHERRDLGLGVYVPQGRRNTEAETISIT